jgi:endonuclease YncB( thermonuclease family)
MLGWPTFIYAAFIATAALSIDQQTMLSGTITHVRDGDTFEVGGIPVRLAALDCPENKTKEGKQVTKYAKRFEGAKVVCELTGAMTYDRVVGYCSVNGDDYGLFMMQNTTCKLWKKYDVFNRYGDGQ